MCRFYINTLNKANRVWYPPETWENELPGCIYSYHRGHQGSWDLGGGYIYDTDVSEESDEDEIVEVLPTPKPAAIPVIKTLKRTICLRKRTILV